MKFLKEFKKKVKKMEGAVLGFDPPAKWYSTGNLTLNKIFSGSYYKGIPEGRITCWAGPSGSGKTYLACNACKQAQDQEAIILYIDSENATDKRALESVGIILDKEEEKVIRVKTSYIDYTLEVLSYFFQEYEAEHGLDNKDAPSVIIIIDSLDMLMARSEGDNMDKGEQKGDQGQRAKQAKALLRWIVNKIQRTNVAVGITHQVYPADPLKGEGLWAINNAIRYACSQIFLVTKLKLRADKMDFIMDEDMTIAAEGKDVVGINMKVEVFKSRFAKIGSNVEIQVPYTSGMNPYSGLIEELVKDGILTVPSKGYLLYTYPDGKQHKFQKNSFKNIIKDVLKDPRILDSEQKMAEIHGSVGENLDLDAIDGKEEIAA